MLCEPGVLGFGCLKRGQVWVSLGPDLQNHFVGEASVHQLVLPARARGPGPVVRADNCGRAIDAGMLQDLVEFDFGEAGCLSAR